MRAFQLEMHEKHTFNFEMHKTADFHSNLLVSWELVTEGYQRRPMKCTHSTHFMNFNDVRDRKTLIKHGNSLYYFFRALL